MDAASNVDISKLKLKDMQSEIIKDISKGIWKSSKEFDIDMFSSQKNSTMDRLIKENSLKKSLENDNLIVLEGIYYQHADLINREDLREDVEEVREDDCISAGDFEDDYNDKNYTIEGKSVPKKGPFEKIEYF